MNDAPLHLCRAAIARCIDYYGLGDDDANPTKRRLWRFAQQVSAGRPLQPLPEGLQYEVEASLGEADPFGAWVALAAVLLNCQETMRATRP